MSTITFQDWLEITQTAYRFAYALDVHDWDLMRSVLDQQVEIDSGTAAKNTEWSNISSGKLAADEHIWNVKVLETGLDGVQHLMGNPQVTINGDTATLVVGFYGEHVFHDTTGSPSYTLGGYQTITLQNSRQRWLISAFKVHPLWTKGNVEVVDWAIQKGLRLLTDGGESPPRR